MRKSINRLTQSFDVTELQKELTLAGIFTSVSSEGNTIILSTDDPAADAIVQAHINTMTHEQRAKAKADAEFNSVIDAKLRENDIKSIRALREYINAQPDAPKLVKDYEAEAITKRSTRK